MAGHDDGLEAVEPVQRRRELGLPPPRQARGDVARCGFPDCQPRRHVAAGPGVRCELRAAARRRRRSPRALRRRPSTSRACPSPSTSMSLLWLVASAEVSSVCACLRNALVPSCCPCARSCRGQHGRPGAARAGDGVGVPEARVRGGGGDAESAWTPGESAAWLTCQCHARGSRCREMLDVTWQYATCCCSSIRALIFHTGGPLPYRGQSSCPASWAGPSIGCTNSPTLVQ